MLCGIGDQSNGNSRSLTTTILLLTIQAQAVDDLPGENDFYYSTVPHSTAVPIISFTVSAFEEMEFCGAFMLSLFLVCAIFSAISRLTAQAIDVCRYIWRLHKEARSELQPLLITRR